MPAGSATAGEKNMKYSAPKIKTRSAVKGLMGSWGGGGGHNGGGGGYR